jgi:hypothetical protein
MQHIETWQGKPVVDWTPDYTEALNAETGYRIRLGWEDEGGGNWADRFAQFLESPNLENVTMLTVGAWQRLMEVDQGFEVAVAAIVSAREKFPNLTALFIGDVDSEECEVSWMRQADLSPLLLAYPNLEHLTARGGDDQGQGLLSFGQLHHAHLKSLAIETGGLRSAVLDEIRHAELPNLEHLELYFGTERYGGTITLEELRSFLYIIPTKFPKITYLGLRDCEFADDLAVAITENGGIAVLQQLSVLDLSLGTLGDSGVEALANCPAIKNLKKLDIHHHYASKESVAKLQALGIEIDASGTEDESKYGRYVAVGE